MATAYRTPKALVMTSSGVFYSDGKSHRLAERLDLADLARVLHGAAQVFRGGEGVVLLDTPMPELDDEHVRTELLGGNWQFTSLRAWTTFKGQTPATGRAVVHLGFLPTILDGHPGPLLAGAEGPADMAMRLGRYHTLVGVPWRYTAGVSGCAALRNRFSDPKPGKQPLWRSDGPRGIRAGGPLIWKAAEQPDPADTRTVAMFDINAMYLAALKNARLAWGALQHTGPTMFDPDWPGYWEIGTDQLPAELVDGIARPPVIRAARIHKGAAWVTTPMAKYLTELVGTIDVLDSWTCANGQTIARQFAERLEAARRGDYGPMGAVELAIKRTYAETVGMFGRDGGSIARRDWAITTMDTGTANMLRRADVGHRASGLWPFEVRTDALFYLIESRADLVNLTHGLGVGTAPGTFKNAKVFTVGEFYERTAVAA